MHENMDKFLFEDIGRTSDKRIKFIFFIIILTVVWS